MCLRVSTSAIRATWWRSLHAPAASFSTDHSANVVIHELALLTAAQGRWPGQAGATPPSLAPLGGLLRKTRLSSVAGEGKAARFNNGVIDGVAVAVELEMTEPASWAGALAAAEEAQSAGRVVRATLLGARGAEAPRSPMQPFM